MQTGADQPDQTSYLSLSHTFLSVSHRHSRFASLLRFKLLSMLLYVIDRCECGQPCDDFRVLQQNASQCQSPRNTQECERLTSLNRSEVISSNSICWMASASTSLSISSCRTCHENDAQSQRYEISSTFRRLIP